MATQGKCIIIEDADFSSFAVRKITPITGSIAINTVASPSAGGSVSGGGYYEEGQNVTLTATANDLYSFNKWSDNVTTATRSITVGSSSATYTALFTAWQQVDLSSYAITGKFIKASTEEWYSTTVASCYLMPVTAGDKYRLIAPADKATAYAFMTANTTTNPPAYASGCTRVGMNAGTSETITIPADCTYLYMLKGGADDALQAPTVYKIS